jgi:hypothetical protein
MLAVAAFLAIAYWAAPDLIDWYRGRRQLARQRAAGFRCVACHGHPLTLIEPLTWDYQQFYDGPLPDADLCRGHHQRWERLINLEVELLGPPGGRDG